MYLIVTNAWSVGRVEEMAPSPICSFHPTPPVPFSVKEKQQLREEHFLCSFYVKG